MPTLYFAKEEDIRKCLVPITNPDAVINQLKFKSECLLLEMGMRIEMIWDLHAKGFMVLTTEIK